MVLEVEVKAPVHDASGTEACVVSLGGVFIGEEVQRDTYFNAPDRDFRETDEALRLRECRGKTFLTYKGPKQGAKTKTRREIEFMVDPLMADVLGELGYTKKGVVEKKRKYFRLEGLTVCLDEVHGLGSCIEIESTSLSDEDKIRGLLGKLGIDKDSCTLKSYLELLEK